MLAHAKPTVVLCPEQTDWAGIILGDPHTKGYFSRNWVDSAI